MLVGKPRDISYIIIALLVLLFNSVEVVLILRIKQKKIFDRLLLSLALSDAVVGVVVSAVKATDIYFGSNFSWLQSRDFLNIFLLSMVFSVTNLNAISVDRFLAVQYPIKHRILSTPKRANIFIVILWFICLISIAFTSLVSFKLAVNASYILNISCISLLIFGALTIMLYCAIFYMICKRKVLISGADRREGNVTRGGLLLFLKGPYKAERSVLLTGCIVAISFIICTYPFAFEFLILRSVERVSYVSKVMLIFNSMLNPFIYFFKSYCGSSISRTTAEDITMN